MGLDEIQHTILNLSQYKRDLSNDIHDRDWKPNHQVKENHLPKPNLRKPPKPQDSMQFLDTFLENIDEPERHSNSAQFNITPVRKIQLTKKGQRDTGSPPIFVNRQRDTGYPLSLGENSLTKPIPPNDLMITLKTKFPTTSELKN